MEGRSVLVQEAFEVDVLGSVHVVGSGEVGGMGLQWNVVWKEM